MGILGDLFGGKSNIRDANAAAEAQRGYTQKAYAGAREQTGQGYDTADTILQGYEAPGRAGYNLYADSLGVNGEAGGQRAMDAYGYARNPYLQYEQDQAAKALTRQNNAGGQRWSGVNAAAVAKARMGLGYQDNQAWQNRLMQFGQQGAQFGTQRASNAISRGDTMAGYDIAENTGYGNIEGQRVANVAAARNQGQNNLMKGIGAIAGIAAAPFTGGMSLGLTAKSLGGMGGGDINPSTGYSDSLPWAPQNQYGYNKLMR